MDTSMIALTKSINDIGNAFEAFKSTNDERIAALKSGNDSHAAELAQKLTRIETSITEATQAKTAIENEMKFQRERLELLESKASQPGRTAAQKLEDDHLKAFNAWIKEGKGQNANLEREISDIARKDVTIGTGSAGGVAVPKVISDLIVLQEKKYSPIRTLVNVVPVTTSDYRELVDLNNASAGWVGESGSRSATLTSQLREVIPTHGELYAYPQASEWSLDDVAFNVENWLSESVGRAFAIQEGSAVITGNGTSKPTGMLNSAPVTTADHASPLRAAAAYQYVACPSSQSPAVAEILPDYLFDLLYTLNAAYRVNSNWVMNSLTTGKVRKLKDNNGQYLWQPSLQAGEPDSLLGRPVACWEQLDDVGTNKFPIAVGDFKQGYTLADRVGLRITRDNVTNVGFVRFYVRRREGGIVRNNDAIKWLKTTLS